MSTLPHAASSGKPQLSPYASAVERGCQALTAVSTGVCPGCEECRELYGYDTLEALNLAYEAGEIVQEPHFSWHGCDICGSTLGGDFEEWHAIDENGELIHGGRACVDCVCYLTNGDEPEERGRGAT